MFALLHVSYTSAFNMLIANPVAAVDFVVACLADWKELIAWSQNTDKRETAK